MSDRAEAEGSRWTASDADRARLMGEALVRLADEARFAGGVFGSAKSGGATAAERDPAQSVTDREGQRDQVIELTEIVPDGLGNYIERSSAVALIE